MEPLLTLKGKTLVAGVEAEVAGKLLGKPERVETVPWRSEKHVLPGGVALAQEVFEVKDHPIVAVRWILPSKQAPVAVSARLFLQGPGEPTHEQVPMRVIWRIPGRLEVAAYTNARYRIERKANGTTISPGIFSGEVSYGRPMEIILAAGGWDEVVKGMILPEHPVLWTA